MSVLEHSMVTVGANERFPAGSQPPPAPPPENRLSWQQSKPAQNFPAPRPPGKAGIFPVYPITAPPLLIIPSLGKTPSPRPPDSGAPRA